MDCVCACVCAPHSNPYRWRLHFGACSVFARWIWIVAITIEPQDASCGLSCMRRGHVHMVENVLSNFPFHSQLLSIWFYWFEPYTIACTLHTHQWNDRTKEWTKYNNIHSAWSIYADGKIKWCIEVYLPRPTHTSSARYIWIHHFTHNMENNNVARQTKHTDSWWLLKRHQTWK